MDISSLLKEGKLELEKKCIESAEIDTWLLLGHCLEMSRTELFLHARKNVSPTDSNRFRDYIKRRGEHEPVAYILGEREFFSLSFFVNPKVLIPRPETEFLIETVLKKVDEKQRKVTSCIDLCCGSGVIGIILARELHCRVTAIDISMDALAVTSKNSARHKVNELVHPLCSDLFDAIESTAKVSLIVSNPPYVSEAEIKDELDKEVAEYEPHLALDGGSAGLDIIEKISRSVLQFLEPGGIFFMEFGADQGEQVIDLFQGACNGSDFFSRVEIFKDYSGRDRVLFAEKNDKNGGY